MEFGPLPEKRAIPSFVKAQSAEDLALKLIRQRHELEAAHKRELAAAQKEADRLAEQLAMLVHKKRHSPPDPFIQSLRQLLKNEGVSLVTYIGEEVTETLESEQDIVEWLPPAEDAVDRVEDALEPEIIRHGRILHRAKLSCRQGSKLPVPYDVPIPAAEESPVPEEAAQTETAPPEPAEAPVQEAETAAAPQEEPAETVQEPPAKPAKAAAAEKGKHFKKKPSAKKKKKKKRK